MLTQDAVLIHTWAHPFHCIDPLFIQFMMIFKLAHLQPPMERILRLCSVHSILDRTSVHRKERLWPRGFCDGANLRRADLGSGA